MDGPLIRLHHSPHNSWTTDADTVHFAYDLSNQDERSNCISTGRYTISQNATHTCIRFESTDPEAFRLLPPKESISLVTYARHKIQSYLLHQKKLEAQGYANHTKAEGVDAEKDIGVEKIQLVESLLEKLRQLEGRERALPCGDIEAWTELRDEIITLIEFFRDENKRVTNGFHHREGLVNDILVEAKRIAEEFAFNPAYSVTRADQGNFYAATNETTIDNEELRVIFNSILPDVATMPKLHAEAIRRINDFFSYEAEYRSYSGLMDREILRRFLLSLHPASNKDKVEEAIQQYCNNEEAIKKAHNDLKQALETSRTQSASLIAYERNFPTEGNTEEREKIAFAVATHFNLKSERFSSTLRMNRWRKITRAIGGLFTFLRPWLWPKEKDSTYGQEIISKDTSTLTTAGSTQTTSCENPSLDDLLLLSTRQKKHGFWETVGLGLKKAWHGFCEIFTELGAEIFSPRIWRARFHVFKNDIDEGYEKPTDAAIQHQQRLQEQRNKVEKALLENQQKTGFRTPEGCENETLEAFFQRLAGSIQSQHKESYQEQNILIAQPTHDAYTPEEENFALTKAVNLPLDMFSEFVDYARKNEVTGAAIMLLYISSLGVALNPSMMLSLLKQLHMDMLSGGMLPVSKFSAFIARDKLIGGMGSGLLMMQGASMLACPEDFLATFIQSLNEDSVKNISMGLLMVGIGLLLYFTAPPGSDFGNLNSANFRDTAGKAALGSLLLFSKPENNVFVALIKMPFNLAKYFLWDLLLCPLVEGFFPKKSFLKAYEKAFWRLMKGIHTAQKVVSYILNKILAVGVFQNILAFPSTIFHGVLKLPAMIFGTIAAFLKCLHPKNFLEKFKQGHIGAIFTSPIALLAFVFDKLGQAILYAKDSIIARFCGHLKRAVLSDMAQRKTILNVAAVVPLLIAHTLLVATNKVMMYSWHFLSHKHKKGVGARVLGGLGCALFVLPWVAGKVFHYAAKIIQWMGVGVSWLFEKKEKIETPTNISLNISSKERKAEAAADQRALESKRQKDLSQKSPTAEMVRFRTLFDHCKIRREMPELSTRLTAPRDEGDGASSTGDSSTEFELPSAVEQAYKPSTACN